MSDKNKVNPGQYTQAGRLSPDEAARERGKHKAPGASETSGGQTPTGISNRESAPEEEDERKRFPQDPSGSANTRNRDDVQVNSNQSEQTSFKSGVRSSAQKAADSKYVERPNPSSKPVEGAFGRKSKH